MWWQRQASGMDNYCSKNEADVAGATLIVRLAADGLRLAQSDGAGRIVARSWEVDPAISVLANLKAMLATVQRPPQGFARVCAAVQNNTFQTRTVLPESEQPFSNQNNSSRK